MPLIQSLAALGRNGVAAHRMDITLRSGIIVAVFPRAAQKHPLAALCGYSNARRPSAIHAMSRIGTSISICSTYCTRWPRWRILNIDLAFSEATSKSPQSENHCASFTTIADVVTDGTQAKTDATKPSCQPTFRSSIAEGTLRPYSSPYVTCG